MAENIAYRIDGQKNSLTLRLRELGGLVRIAGDLAVQDGAELVQETHVLRSETLCKGIDPNNPQGYGQSTRKDPDSYGNYFF